MDKFFTGIEHSVIDTLSVVNLTFEKICTDIIDVVYTNKNIALLNNITGFSKDDLLVSFCAEHRFDSTLFYNALSDYTDIYKIKRNKAYVIGTFTLLYNVSNFLLEQIKNIDFNGNKELYIDNFSNVVNNFGIKYCKSLNTLFVVENENKEQEMFNYKKTIIYLDTLKNNELKEIYFEIIYPVKPSNVNDNVYYKFLTNCNYNLYIENNIRDNTYFTLEDSYSNEITINNLVNKDNPESIYNSTKPNNVILH